MLDCCRSVRCIRVKGFEIFMSCAFKKKSLALVVCGGEGGCV